MSSSYQPPHAPPSPVDERPLPPGWTKQYDEKYNRFFYVDTQASPPRSSWIHPADDPSLLLSSSSKPTGKTSTPPRGSLDNPPPYDSKSGHLAPNTNKSRPSTAGSNHSDHGTSSKSTGGVLGFLHRSPSEKKRREEEKAASRAARDAQRRAEDEAEHVRRLEMQRRAQEIYQQRAQAMRAQQEALAAQRAAGYGPGYGQGYGQQYGGGGFGGLGGMGGGRYGYSQPPRRTGGGMGMPLALGAGGGLLGGMMLGSAMGDMGDGGGDMGGGDYGGGDMGGGDFGGGDMGGGDFGGGDMGGGF